jgi:hypothetical protein
MFVLMQAELGTKRIFYYYFIATAIFAAFTWLLVLVSFDFKTRSEIDEPAKKLRKPKKEIEEESVKTSEDMMSAEFADCMDT